MWSYIFYTWIILKLCFHTLGVLKYFNHEKRALCSKNWVTLHWGYQLSQGVNQAVHFELQIINFQCLYLHSRNFFLPCYVQWRYIPKEIFKGLSIHENIPMSPVTKSFASKSWKVTLIFIYVLTLGSNLIFQYSNFQNQNSNVNKGNQRWPIFNKHQRFVWVL